MVFCSLKPRPASSRRWTIQCTACGPHPSCCPAWSKCFVDVCAIYCSILLSVFYSGLRLESKSVHITGLSIALFTSLLLFGAAPFWSWFWTFILVSALLCARSNPARMTMLNCAAVLLVSCCRSAGGRRMAGTWIDLQSFCNMDTVTFRSIHVGHGEIHGVFSHKRIW